MGMINTNWHYGMHAGHKNTLNDANRKDLYGIHITKT